ncbi:hypothetical protein X758_13010 [Mesorhizobium sp. LSHC416B00]|nr:hypothetical protein X761_00080 [Mesorhizobium sp. LSHC424B00]ESX72314.1 hypothetical protein X758_13010 [Mesorhizobium sp. LSHC416B00]
MSRLEPRRAAGGDQATVHLSPSAYDVTADLPDVGSMGRWGGSSDSKAVNLWNGRLVAFISAMLGAIATVILIWLPFSTVAVDPVLWSRAGISALPLALIWGALGAMRYQLRKTPFRYRDLLSDFAGKSQALVVTLGVIMSFSVGLLLLCYLASATRRPLMDGYLAAGDAALGFNWVQYVRRLNEHPWAAFLLSSAYSSLRIQLFLIPAILVLTARSGRLVEFLAHFGLAGCLTCLVLVAIPAAGAFDFYDPSAGILSSFGPGASTRHLDQLYALRTLRPFVVEHPEGLVTFPSFHSALAAIFVYSMRGIRYVAPPIYLLNAMLIIATLPQGSHYLVDVLAGLAVAAASFQSVRWIARAGRP